MFRRSLEFLLNSIKSSIEITADRMRITYEYNKCINEKKLVQEEVNQNYETIAKLKNDIEKLKAKKRENMPVQAIIDHSHKLTE